jgi:multidrug efflux pump subunit AcrA (membrane-fusion protein)
MRTAVRHVRAHPLLSGIAGVLVLAAAASATYFGTRSTPANAATATTRTQTASTGTVKESVSATGTLAPTQQEQLNFLASGQVTAVDVTTGQQVKKGQALATIDSATLAANKAQAAASVASEQAKVDNDNSTGATTTQLAADQAALTAAQNQLSSAKSQLAEATLTSPIKGVVASVNLTVGQSVSGSGASSSGSSSGSSSSSGATGGSGGTGGSGSALGGAGTAGSASSSSSSTSSPQILVISTDSWIVNATVDASSVGQIKVNNEAQLTVTGASSAVYGTVASIGLVSSSTTGTASYPVVIDVTGTPSGLHDGANVTASITYKQVSGIVVPTLALHRNSSGGQYVEQVKNGKTTQTTVQVGVSAGGQTQITSGLTAGAQILVPVPQVTGGNGSTSGGTTGGGFGGAGGGFGGTGGGFGGAGAGGGFPGRFGNGAAGGGQGG